MSILFMGIKNVVIGIAIIILTISVAVYGINTFYSGPEYSDFCEEFKTAKLTNNSETCEAIGGKWNPEFYPPRVIEGGAQGYCDRDYFCRQDFEDASERHSKIVFMIALPLGIIILVVGAIVFGLEAVGAGLMGGGVGIILYGVGGFWRFADDWLKFVLSLLGLIVLIWFTYWYNNRVKKKRSFFKKFF